MSRVVIDQFAAQWATLRRPRSFLGSVLAMTLAVLFVLVALAIVLVTAVVAIPVALIFGAVWWVRRRLPRVRGDGRRNVRVIGGPASGSDA